ncbi:alpha-1-antitrypsin-like [Planococcus citri]|uniref:alpha-1-antitrypsin-like n=1 Tax=Planococcus citri TaxID=170843 RepID=UPI0031F74509
MITSNVGHVQHNEDYQMIELFKQYLAPGASQFALAMAKLLYNPSGVKNLIFSPIEDLHLIADQTPSANVDLKLPRMKFKWISDINHYLAQLGLRQVFTDQSQLSKMTGPIPIKITKVTHAAEIEVDENETKATAVTVIGMAFGCGPRIPKPRKQFHVNRPFVFYIHHRITKSILFLGAVHNPQQG